MRPSTTLMLKFLEKVSAPTATGCWLWKAATNGKKGYGRFCIGGCKVILAQRAAFSMTYGEIPAGAFVCHTCDNPLCVNPQHLFLGNNSINMKDCHIKGRSKNVIRKGENHLARLSVRSRFGYPV
jgi:hypothetical protein